MKNLLRRQAEELQDKFMKALVMLEEEGQSDGEGYYKKILSEVILFAFFRIADTITVGFFAFGLVLGHILSHIF